MMWPGSDLFGRTKSRKYIFGLGRDIIVLRTMAWGNVVELTRNEILHDNIIIFDRNWPKHRIKNFTFRGQCAAVADSFMSWYLRNVGLPNRLLQDTYVDYGILVPDSVKIINEQHGASISVQFTSVLGHTV